MKNETIIWFKNGATAKKSEIHFDDDGQICFNDAARQVLPKHVNLGLAAAKNCLELYVCKSTSEDGMSTARRKSNAALTTNMYERGIPFPCIFELNRYDAKSNIWTAVLINEAENILIADIQNASKTDGFSARSCHSMQKLLNIYHGELLSLCRKYAKTIPKEDRLGIAQEGFWQAALQYKPNLHKFRTFSANFVKNYLESNIKQYAAAYREMYSLEQQNADGKFYDIFDDPQAVSALDDVDMDVAVSRQVSATANDMYLLIKQGYDFEEIMDILHLSQIRMNLLRKELQTALQDILQEDERKK